MRLLLTMAAGGAFGLLVSRRRVPGGMMVGAIVGVSLLNIFWDAAYMPTWASLLAQMAAGAYIGSSVERRDVLQMRRLWKPFLLIIGNYVILNFVGGWLLMEVSPLDSITALLSAIPGGMTDLPVIAVEMGADAPKVAALQFLRMLVGAGVFPSMILAVSKHEPQRSRATETVGDQAALIPQKKDMAKTMVTAILAGLVGRVLGIPAGVLLFSMAGVILRKIAGSPAALPSKFKRYAQWLSGSYIGSLVSRGDLLELRTLVLPAVLLLTLYTANCFFTGFLLRRYFGFTLREGMLTATPAGATDLALITADMDLDNPDVVVLQTFRMMVAISLFPQMALLASQFYR